MKAGRATPCESSSITRLTSKFPFGTALPAIRWAVGLHRISDARRPRPQGLGQSIAGVMPKWSACGPRGEPARWGPRARTCTDTQRAATVSPVHLPGPIPAPSMDRRTTPSTKRCDRVPVTWSSPGRAAVGATPRRQCIGQVYSRQSLSHARMVSGSSIRLPIGQRFARREVASTRFMRASARSTPVRQATVIAIQAQGRRRSPKLTSISLANPSSEPTGPRVSFGEAISVRVGPTASRPESATIAAPGLSSSRRTEPTCRLSPPAASTATNCSVPGV